MRRSGGTSDVAARVWNCRWRAVVDRRTHGPVLAVDRSPPFMLVHPELGGWTAGALTDTAIAAVSLAGGSASRATAVRLLGQLVDRM
jgi:hypothetical protein